MDIAGRCIGSKCALRLREAGYMKGPNMDIPENLDHCVTEVTCGGFFSAHILTRDMWMGNS